jgi:hypothetical protein
MHFYMLYASHIVGTGLCTRVFDYAMFCVWSHYVFFQVIPARFVQYYTWPKDYNLINYYYEGISNYKLINYY